MTCFSEARLSFFISRAPKKGDAPKGDRAGPTGYHRGLNRAPGAGGSRSHTTDCWYTDDGLWRRLQEDLGHGIVVHCYR